jgi:hypothetical protein
MIVKSRSAGRMPSVCVQLPSLHIWHVCTQGHRSFTHIESTGVQLYSSTSTSESASKIDIYIRNRPYCFYQTIRTSRRRYSTMIQSTCTRYQYLVLRYNCNCVYQVQVQVSYQVQVSHTVVLRVQCTR